MTIHASPAFFGSVMGPVYVAPGASVRTSPGAARSIAAWRSPPAGTATVFAEAAAGFAWASRGAAWVDTPAQSTPTEIRTRVSCETRR